MRPAIRAKVTRIVTGPAAPWAPSGTSLKLLKITGTIVITSSISIAPAERGSDDTPEKGQPHRDRNLEQAPR